MKRILQVVPNVDLNGVAVFNMNHYRELREECQFDFMVVETRQSPFVVEIESYGGHIYCSGPTELRHIFRFLRRAVSIMKEHGPYDAVHSHMGIASGWFLLAALLAGVPVRIAHSHGTNGREGGFPVRVYREFLVVLARVCATAVLACGETAGAYLFGKRHFEKNGRVIHNSISVKKIEDVPEETVSALAGTLNIPPDCPLVVGNITRYSFEKNPLFTVEVFSKILRLQTGAVLIMGGPDDGMRQSVEERVRELGIEEHVRLLGRREDIPVCLKLINVYVLPSLFEGLPIGLLEAQASGCFCMASENVPREVDMGLGAVRFLSLQASPEEWAKAIVSQSRDNVRPGREAVEEAFARQGYDLPTTAHQLLEIYNGG